MVSTHEEEIQYATTLGLFVMKFAEVERTVSVFLSAHAGLTWRMSRALLSGVRMDAARNLVGRVLDAKNVADNDPDRQQVIAALAHLALISNVRNDILHYGPDHDPTLGMIATNAFGSHAPAKSRKAVISPDILNAMRSDLDKIIWTLAAQMTKMAGSEVAEELSEALRRPWLYTPQQLPTGSDPKIPRNSRKRERRLPSSQA